MIKPVLPAQKAIGMRPVNKNYKVYLRAGEENKLPVPSSIHRLFEVVHWWGSKMKALGLLLLSFLGPAITDNDIFGDDLIEQVSVTNKSCIVGLFQGKSWSHSLFLGRWANRTSSCFLSGRSGISSLLRTDITSCSCCICQTLVRQEKFGRRQNHKDCELPSPVQVILNDNVLQQSVSS